MQKKIQNDINIFSKCHLSHNFWLRFLFWFHQILWMHIGGTFYLVQDHFVKNAKIDPYKNKIKNVAKFLGIFRYCK